MRAIDIIEMGFKNFALKDEFVEVERQILREETVAEVSFKSNSLRIMIKLFISEMEGEAGLYVAPLATMLGYRELPGWIDEWTIVRSLSTNPSHKRMPLDKLSGLPFPTAHSQAQLEAVLEWLYLNINLIADLINAPVPLVPRR